MLGKNHIVVGLASYAVAGSLLLETPTTFINVFGFIMAFVGSLLPDIDHPGSKLGKTVPFISYPISKIFGHRGITHSLLMVVALIFVIDHYMDVEYYGVIVFGLIVGYISHLFADYLTKAGIPLFYPHKKSFRIPLFSFRTGSFIEYFVTYSIVILSVSFFFQDEIRPYLQ